MSYYYDNTIDRWKSGVGADRAHDKPIKEIKGDKPISIDKLPEGMDSEPSHHGVYL